MANPSPTMQAVWPWATTCVENEAGMKMLLVAGGLAEREHEELALPAAC